MIPTFVKKTPGYRLLRDALARRLDPFATNKFLQFAPPGHFYSPIPDLALVDRYKDRLFDRQVHAVPGVDNHDESQLALLEELAPFYADLPFKTQKSSGLRYHLDNPFFRYGDAVILYSMLRHYRPRRVIEVGSGFSSAVMLDTNDIFLSGSVRFTFVEPFPERLLSLLSDSDKTRHEIIASPVQDVPLEVFESLRANDVLFIDSSHTAKIGSDVVHLLSHVLPPLNNGVIVHFHDVFWPFEYPEEWIRQGRAWNEDYMLKAFLQFNSRFRILFFNSYLATHYPEALTRHYPRFLEDPGGSLWIAKTDGS